MKKTLSFFVLILSSTLTFAQDGYFVKAGFGAGTSTSSFNVISGDAYKNNMDILSTQGQVNLGYNHGNWQLETGLGYWQTGVSFIATNGVPVCGLGPNTHTTPEVSTPTKYTIKNPHLTVPVMASYTMYSNRKLSFSPGIGLEVLYNFNGKMTTSADVDPSLYGINYSYNSLAAALLLKCDVQYRICKTFSVWCSPSYQNMVTSLTTKVQGDIMSRTYDRAFLFNVGVKYNLHCCQKQHAELHGVKS